MKVNKKILKFFTALSDETRLKILLTLIESSKTVTEVHKAVGNKITLSAISHQLKYLENLKIIISKKKGREKSFNLSSNFCWCMLKDAVKHFDNTKLKKQIIR